MTDDASPLASGQWRRDIICVTVVSGDREDDIQASTVSDDVRLLGSHAVT